MRSWTLTLQRNLSGRSSTVKKMDHRTDKVYDMRLEVHFVQYFGNKTKNWLISGKIVVR